MGRTVFSFHNAAENAGEKNNEEEPRQRFFIVKQTYRRYKKYRIYTTFNALGYSTKADSCASVAEPVRYLLAPAPGKNNLLRLLVKKLPVITNSSNLIKTLLMSKN